GASGRFCHPWSIEERAVRIDLHRPSNASDGSLAPADLVRAAARVGLSVIALADHETTAGVPAAIDAAGDAVRVIPALEVSTSDMGSELHILGYLVDPMPAALL